MQKKIFSLILILIIAICGGIFAACGQQNPADRVSLSISDGLDSSLSNSSLNSLAEQLSLSQSEKVALTNGKGYDNKITAGNVVTLLIDSQNFESREIIVKINGFKEEMSRQIYFSSDSSIVTFSNIEYLSDGRAKVIITGISAGTAEVTAISGQYSKKVTFTIKVLELPTNFSIKSETVIYLEKNSTLTINASDYIDFYPSTTNMKDLLFYKGYVLLTSNGITTLTSVKGATNAITEDTQISVISTRLNKVQSITVKVIDKLSSTDINLQKLVYSENGEVAVKQYQTIDDTDILTVIKNSSKKYESGVITKISYGIREVYIIIQNTEVNLKIGTKVLVNGFETDILALPNDYELITQNNYASSNYAELITGYIGSQAEYSFHVWKFEFQYTGYDSYNIEFSFGINNYTYLEKKNLSIEFKSASNLIEFRKSSEIEQKNDYIIYDSYDGIYGTKFVIGTNAGSMTYSLQLVLDAEDLDLDPETEGIQWALGFLTTTNRVKTPVLNDGKYIITVVNGENFYIKGNANSARKTPYLLIVRVIYTHDGITFETFKEIEITVKKAPSLLEFSQADIAPEISDQNNITNYNFDLNSENKFGVNGNEYEYGQNSLSLYLYTYDSSKNLVGNAIDYSINNTSNILLVSIDELSDNKINLVATGVGEGSFKIILGNNISATFTFKIINSLNSLEIILPSNEQNENVFSLQKNYSFDGNIYANYLVAFTNKSVPIKVKTTGDIKTLNIFATNVTYSNGYIKTANDFEKRIVNISISYEYIDSNNAIKTISLTLTNQLLISSFTNISNFTLTTSKNANNFTLYDYNSVGFYGRDLATATIYTNILPITIAPELLTNIEWETNISAKEFEYSFEDNNDTYIITTNVFEFTYYKSTGIATLLCKVTDDNLFNDKGEFTAGTIVLRARINRNNYGTYSKSIQFNVLKNQKVETITINDASISLDAYEKSHNLYVNLYPSNAANQNLIYKFIPSGSLSASAIIFSTNPNGSLKISLNNEINTHGNGILRIIAADSYTDSSHFTKWIDVAIRISDGESIAYPFEINSPEDIIKMIDTDFAKYYEISGSIDLSLISWNYSQYELTGHINGINNAELKGIIIQHKNKNNLGLFSSISGSIKNIKISGTINIDCTDKSIPSELIYVGLLAGENSGVIEDVYVELNGGRVIAYNDYKFSIGGMVGLNTGIIKTTISSNSTYTRLVRFKNYLEFIDKTSTVEKDFHTLYIGGVVGTNYDGKIKRVINDNNLVEYNNNFVSAEVYIKAYYNESGFTTGVETLEAIGGICGYSKSTSIEESGLYGVSAFGEIVAGKWENNLFYGHFDNIGGLVGFNELNITYSEIGNADLFSQSSVYVRGKDFVGGAVGVNKGEISHVLVEVLESGRTGLDVSLVIGENFVGGLIGEHNEGSIITSSLISYLNRNFKNKIDDLDKDYLGDVIVIESSNIYNKFSLIFGNQITNAMANYVIAVANIQFISTNSAWNNNQNLNSVLSNNFAVYGNYIDQNALTEKNIIDKVYLNNQEQNPVVAFIALIEISGFEFVYLPPNFIDFKLEYKGEENKLLTDDEDDAPMFFLNYFSTSKTNYQNEINLKNIYSINEFIKIGNEIRKSILTVEEGSAYLEINTSSKFIVKGTGLVKITIRTPYNVDLVESYYIYIVNYANNLSAYLSSTKTTSEIKDDSKITFDATENSMIYFSFLDKGNIYGLASPKDVKVLAKVQIDNITIIIKEGESLTAANFRLVRISEDSYQLIVNNQIVSQFTDITFIPYYEYKIGNKTYTTYVYSDGEEILYSKAIKANNELSDIDISTPLNLDNEITFKYQLISTTKSVTLSTHEIVTEPYYETNMNVVLDSLNPNETLIIRISMIDPVTRMIDTSFDINWIKIVANYDGILTENGTTEARINNFKINEINAENNNKINIAFKYEDAYREFDKNRVFIVTFITSNNKTAQLTLTYEPQQAINVTTTLYDLKTESDTQNYGFSGVFSYIPSNRMIPGQVSLLEFNIIPRYTNYSYIEVVNLSSNQYNLLFDLFDRTMESEKIGAVDINGGIRIDKSLIINGKFYLRSFLTDSISDNTTLSIKIIFKDEKGTQIGEQITQLFYIEHIPGVVLTIDGVRSGNEDLPLKLARGLVYDLNVWVKGYSSSNLIKSGNTYIDGELVFIVSDIDLINIIKNNDGSYQLIVTKDTVINRNVIITTYGLKQTQEKIEKSKEAIIYLEINEFVIKASSVEDIVSGVQNSIYSSATGNSYEFAISLNNNILLYDKTNSEIVGKVMDFLSALSTGVLTNAKISVWSYQDVNKTTTTWTKVTEGNTAFLPTGKQDVCQYNTSNGVFRLTFNIETQVLSVIFMKTEDSNNPTFKFKYSASYYYDNGVPTLYINNSNGQSIHLLEQVFRFDIYEKTDLRNPYPIYTINDLLDMREGNYYILMNDITLPTNFKPIATLIGGLDGNNHKIIVPSLSLESTVANESINFGLFATTSADALLENIILYISGNKTINISKYNKITYGLLVSINYGQITNCAIEGDNYSIIHLNLIGLSSPGIVVNDCGALVGINYGNITNGRIEVGIVINGDIIGDQSSYMPTNLGGIVSINKSGAAITSSYVNARIDNKTGTSSPKTAGVAAINENGARIFTTYVSGNYETNTDSPFADGTFSVVFSAANSASFVYDNYGEISNCYANIRTSATAAASGFVYDNKQSGKISYSYSTSIVGSTKTTNSSFIGVLATGEILNKGKLEQCYGLGESSGFYYFTREYIYKGITYNKWGKIPSEILSFIPSDSKLQAYNYGIGSNAEFKKEELLILNLVQFNSKQSFSEYAVSQTADKCEGIWFWPEELNSENAFVRNGAYMTFHSGRPELVAPNIIASGMAEFDYSYYNEETGITRYVYRQINGEKGSKFNPYIIATTDDVEYVKEGAINFLIREKYYRVISDIIYATSTTSSGLYKYSFLGNIEGNGFTIGRYVLDSAEILDSAGFFATIGTQSNQVGSIKNLTFAPRYISLTNAHHVGAVAGKIYSTNLVNIYVDGFKYSSSSDGVVILGKNCIGGVVGMAFGNYNFNQISANISVNSTYRAELNGHEVKSIIDGNLTKVSYSGIIAGALDGYGMLLHIDAFGNNVSIAEYAGLMFGYVGRNISASFLTATSASKQYIKADVYGGVIAAQNNGILKEILVEDISNKLSFFVAENYIPVAIGNLVGLMTGGTIEKAEVNTKLVAQTGIFYVGGAVGVMKAGILDRITINGDITAGATIGGLIGYIYNTIEGWKVNIIDSYHNGTINSTSSISTVRIGSLIGYADVVEEGLDVKEIPSINNVGADKKFTLDGVEYTIGTNSLTYSGESIQILNGEFTIDRLAYYVIDLVNDRIMPKILTQKINILLSSDFIKNKTSIPAKNIKINSYAYSSDLQIWVGIIICKGNGIRGKLFGGYNPLLNQPVGDFQKIYAIDINDKDIFIASSLKYLLNGEIKLK